MSTKLDDPKKMAELKKQLEALAGHEIDASPQQIIKFRYPVSSSTSADGSTTARSTQTMLEGGLMPLL